MSQITDQVAYPSVITDDRVCLPQPKNNFKYKTFAIIHFENRSLSNTKDSFVLYQTAQNFLFFSVQINLTLE